MMRFLIVSVILLSCRADDFPSTLTATRLFANLPSLSACDDLIPYEINLSFWSDGAQKRRWFRLPPGEKMNYSPHDQWSVPSGTLFVKHFETSRREPIETRLLLFTGTNVSGASYRWRQDGCDADLLTTNLSTHGWYFPSREDCRTCHNSNAGFILGLNTRQLNRNTAHNENQIERWVQLGLLETSGTSLHVRSADRFSCDSVDEKLRAYLDVNCAFCHRPGGTVSHFDARFSTPLEHLVNAPVYFNQGIDNARVIAPRDPWRSILLLRLQTTDELRMPPLAHQQVDMEGVSLFSAWINSLDGPTVTSPPHIEPAGGRISPPATIRITHPDRDAVIRFTLDGSPPGKNSEIYKAPLTLTGPATVRARAYKEGTTRSTIVQETFIPED